MKTIILGVGAFGFAILKHLSEIHSDDAIFAYEKNDLVVNYLKNFKKHPYFFEGIKLGENIVFIDKLEDELQDTDLLILALPCQVSVKFISSIKEHLKPGLTILNLSKGINNKTLNTISDDLKVILEGFSYNYASLSGGMLAGDLVKGNIIGASIGVESEALGNILLDYFETPKFRISICTGKVKNTELAGALKNIFSIFTGYYEGLGYGTSTIGYFFCEYYPEYKKLFSLLGGDENIIFEKYAIGGDLIASCFGNSRNRYFGKLIGEGMKTIEVLKILEGEKKIAEGYETLKGIYELIKDKDQFPITKELGKKILFKN